MADFIIHASVEEQLNASLVEKQDLLAGLGQTTPVEVLERPGTFRSNVELIVRRPLDLETAEVREVQVFMRRVDSGMEVFEVEGLDLPEAEEKAEGESEGDS